MERIERQLFFRQNGIFGLIVGLSFMAATSVFLLSGNGLNFQANGETVTLLGTVGVFLGVRKYRNEELDGAIGYGKAFGACVFESATAIAAYGIFLFYLYSSRPDIREGYLGILDANLQMIYGGNPYLEDIRRLVRTFMNPAGIAFGEVFNRLLGSALVSLFLAGILRRKNKL